MTAQLIASVYLEKARDKGLDAPKREIMMNRIAVGGQLPNAAQELINLYNDMDTPALKAEAITKALIYLQSHVIDKPEKAQEEALLADFFASVLKEEKLEDKEADNAIRGYVETHTAQEVEANLTAIDAALAQTNSFSRVMLQYTLMFKSNSLQPLYAKKIADLLETQDNSELDSYFFGPLSLSLHENKNLLRPETVEALKPFMEKREARYSKEHLPDDKNDYHRLLTAPLYEEVRTALGMD